MADVNIIVKTFEDLKIIVKPQEEVRIIVPVTEEEEGIFDPSFDFTFE